MKDWYLWWRSPTLYPTRAQLEVVEYPWWARMPDVLLNKLCSLTGHRICNPPEWTFKIPLKWDWDDEYDMWDVSLGSWIMGWLGTATSFVTKHQTLSYKVDVDDAWLEKYGLGDPCDLNNEDNENALHNDGDRGGS